MEPVVGGLMGVGQHGRSQLSGYEAELSHPPCRLKVGLAVSPSRESIAMEDHLSGGWGRVVKYRQVKPQPLGWLCALGQVISLSFICSVIEMTE